MKPRAAFLQRLAALAALAVAFLIMASVFVPDRSRAEFDFTTGDAGSIPSTDPHEGLTSLGTLETGKYLIKIHAAQRLPLYSIYDREGTELGVLLTAEQVATRFPELPIRQMEFDAEPRLREPLQIMRAEPTDHGR